MTHPKIKQIMATFGVSESDAMFMVALDLGIIDGDVDESPLEGEELDAAVLKALDEQGEFYATGESPEDGEDDDSEQ